MNIYSKMLFNNYAEFFNKRKKIRVYYRLLTFDEKREYKNFVYSSNLKEYIKDKIWEYFNENKISPYYVFDYELIGIMRIYERNKNNVVL